MMPLLKGSARGAVLFMALLVITSVFPHRAGAIETWCADDPLVSVGGRLLDIQVQMPVANVATMRSTTLTVIIPRNVSGAVLVDDVSAFQMRTIISPTGPAWNGTGGLPVTIRVDVESPAEFPLRVVATPLLAPGAPLAGPTTAYGKANTPLLLKMALGR